MFRQFCFVNFSSVFLPKVSIKAYVFGFSGTSIEAHWVAEVDHHDVRLTEGAIIHGTKAGAPTAKHGCSNAQSWSELSGDHYSDARLRGPSQESQKKHENLWESWSIEVRLGKWLHILQETTTCCKILEVENNNALSNTLLRTCPDMINMDCFLAWEFLNRPSA